MSTSAPVRVHVVRNADAETMVVYTGPDAEERAMTWIGAANPTDVEAGVYGIDISDFQCFYCLEWCSSEALESRDECADAGCCVAWHCPNCGEQVR